MVGPFMQGMLLMGIIYWYSRGMMSLINDYYRSEFQRKLKTEDIKNDTVYDTDDISNLIKTENLFRSEEQHLPYFKTNYRSIERVLSAKMLFVGRTLWVGHNEL